MTAFPSRMSIPAGLVDWVSEAMLMGAPGYGMSTASGYWGAAEVSGLGWAVWTPAFCTVSGGGATVVTCCAARCAQIAVTPVILMKKQTLLRTIAGKNRAPRDLCAIAGCPPFRFVTHTTL
jgi:hypothetical protein